MNLYDIETEEETLHILRAQNKKLQNLYNEIENKDKLILKLQTDSSKISEYNSQIDNYKRQIYSTERKVKELEDALKISQISIQDQLKQIGEMEQNFNIQLNSKEKVIFDVSETIKQYEQQISKLKKEINEKNLIINSAKNETNDIRISNKNSLLKISLYEEEIAMIKKEKDELDSQYNKSKLQFEEKAEELIDLIKQQYTELSNLSQKNAKLENENINLRGMNKNYKKEIDEMIINIQELKDNQFKFNQMDARVNEAENFISDLQNIIEAERNKNNELLIRLEDVNNKNVKLFNSVSEVENLKEAIHHKEEEIRNNIQQIEVLKEIGKNKEVQIKEMENESASLIQYVNECIMTYLKWADTYIGVYINTNYNNIVDIQIPHFVNTKVKLNIDKFSTILINIQKRINKDLSEYEETISELKNENNELTKKCELLIAEYSQLKEDFLHINDENLMKSEMISKLNREIENSKTSLTTLEKDKRDFERSNRVFLEKLISDFKLNHTKIKDSPNLAEISEFVFHHPFSENIKDQVRDYFDNFMEFINHLIKEYGSSLIKMENLSNLKNECYLIKKEFEKYKQFYQEEKDHLIQENMNKISNFENTKNADLKRIEDTWKLKTDKLRTEIFQKEDLYEKLNQDYKLLQSQLQMVEYNYEEFRLKRKEYEDQILGENEQLKTEIKLCENELKKLQSELETKINNYNNLEQTTNKKNSEIEELKIKIQKGIEQNDLIEQRNRQLEIELMESKNMNSNLKEKIIISNESTQYSKNNMSATNSYNYDQNYFNYQESLKLAEEELKLKDINIKRLVNEVKHLQERVNERRGSSVEA